MENKITKVYYVHNNIKYYHEFKKWLPDKFVFRSNNKENYLTNYDGPSDLWDKLMISDSDFKLCRNDGPALIYFNGTRWWKSSKCKNPSVEPINFGKNTNHILCKYCYNFCKQMCFV